MTALIVIWALGLWVGLVANTLTYWDRGKLIDAVFDDNDEWVRFKVMYDSVSPHKHLWYRSTFRNPFKLYSEELQERVKSLGSR